MATTKQTARALLRANRKNGVSWRKISRLGYRENGVNVLPGIAHGTLCRFAKSKGAWLPASEEIKSLLGIINNDKHPKPKSLWDMSTSELLHALNNRHPMIATHRKKAMDDFIRACKRASRKERATL